MSKSHTLRIPPEAKRMLDAAAELLDRRRSDDLVDAEKAATERAVSAEVERAGQSLERIEIDLAVADADGDEDRHAKLTAARTAASEPAAKAREALATAQRTRRGVANRRVALEDEIAASEHAVTAAIHEVRQAVLIYWREKLHDALTGATPGGLVAVLREGWAINAAIGVPNHNILELDIHDPLRFAQGFGTRMMLTGRRNFAGSADGRTAEDMSTSWRDDPALKALHNSLSPYQMVEREVRVVAIKVRDRAERERLAPKAVAQLREAPAGPTAGELAAMSEGEYRTHFAAAERRAHPGARYQPNMQVHRSPENRQ